MKLFSFLPSYLHGIDLLCFFLKFFLPLFFFKLIFLTFFVIQMLRIVYHVMWCFWCVPVLSFFCFCVCNPIGPFGLFRKGRVRRPRRLPYPYSTVPWPSLLPLGNRTSQSWHSSRSLPESPASPGRRLRPLISGSISGSYEFDKREKSGEKIRSVSQGAHLPSEATDGSIAWRKTRLLWTRLHEYRSWLLWPVRDQLGKR